jgi:NADPH-dependent glutamate synthase beta subunit-like oxidoreductase/NAD(P)H-flavin reductase
MPTSGRTSRTSSSTLRSDSSPGSADFAPLRLSPDDLHTAAGLAGIDRRFLDFLAQTAPELHARLLDVRASRLVLTRDQASALMLALAPSLQTFIADLFGLRTEVQAVQRGHAEFDAMYRVKWKFVRRQAALAIAPEALLGFDPDTARERLLNSMRDHVGDESATTLTAPRAGFDEAVFARAVLAWQSDPQQHERLELARHYSAWAATTPQGQAFHRDSVLFRLPEAHDPATLARALPRDPPDAPTVSVIRVHPRSARLGAPESAFSLTDAGTDRAGALDQSRYCLICHRNQTDSCSRGLDDQHAGCPLGERISEFHALRNDGLIIAALAMITADNPMVAATGHRICNDCVQACVFQTQTPVDIPQTESQTLKEVLSLPWGVEIYGLLTQWNPLNLTHPLPRPDSGRKVLVAGAGPAGFTLAHHLLRDGHTVVLIDALRIEPLPPALSAPRQALREAAVLEGPLEARTPAGFGGVAEYGITVRWNKNRLDLIRLLLERRERFALLGSVRLGSTMGVQDALDLGFDHIALAVGAGRPHLPDWPASLARGVRTASDFLMALQLEGAARAHHLGALQIHLPAVVIGGGLTALDAATEMQAWYVVQVLRYAQRHRALIAESGRDAIEARWNDEDRETARVFLEHAQAIEREQAQAVAAGRPPDLKPLLRAWGGVTVLYRRALGESPAWRLNPTEVMHALDEGIQYVEQATPTHFEVDAHGAVQAVHAHVRDLHRRLPARSVLLALGTEPNTGLVDDDRGLRRDGAWFALQGLDPAAEAAGAPGSPPGEQPSRLPVLLADPEHCPPERRQRLSVFGDAHPAGVGSVVKAMASAQRGWPVLSEVLAARAPRNPQSAQTFIAGLRDALTARVQDVTLLAPGIVQLIIRAPMAARRFQPGQFFRLQTLEQDALTGEVQGQPIRRTMEGLALTGAEADPVAGRVTLVVLEMGGSSDLCRWLRPGQEVSLMGPTGAPTEIPESQTVVLAGGGLGNAVLLPIGKALRAAGCRVLYFAAYRRASDVFHRSAIEAAADRVVWCCESDPAIVPSRPQDRAWRGNIVQAMQAWQAGARFIDASGDNEPDNDAGPLARDIAFDAVDRLLVIGSDRMMAAVAKLRQTELRNSLGRAQVNALASVNSPMQCMMKGVCGQCVQWLVDPGSGIRRAVFTCAEQDQPLDWIDFDHLAQRLSQNRLLEQQMRSLLHCTKPQAER